jgi:cytochrome c oxidase cbb3-type subunit 3
MFENLNVSTDTVNQLSLVGAAAIIILTVVVVGKYIKQMKTDTSSGELADENWDGIGEYKNPLPLGWAVSMVGTMIWGLWYWFAGYPLNAYSQLGEYNEEVAAYNKTFEAQWANPSEETLHDMGEGVFLVNCAPCHGIAADGIDGKAQDLTNPMYKSYGVEGLSASISFGKTGEIGTMPAFQNTLTEIQTKAVATYIMSLSK